MNILEHVSLSNVLWYKIGGKTRYLLECETTQDVLDALKFIKEKGIEKVFVCGLGANLLFSDNDFNGAVVRLASPKLTENNKTVTTSGISNIKLINGTEAQIFAGELLDSLILFAFDNNLAGLEWAGGLPGTVGAAVRGNVGAFGKEIKDNLISVEVIDQKTHVIQTLTNKELDFSYRNSFVKQNRNLIVLSATFKFNKITEQELLEARKVYEECITYRKTHHPDPLVYPNTGSVFKNIKEPEHIAKVLEIWPDVKKLSTEKWHGKISVAYLNERLGFAGFRVGNAQVSELHNNFILNLGGAKATDVRSVISSIQEKFTQTFGFKPELEVEIV